MNWYAKGGKLDAATEAQLKEEKQLAREAEEDMMRVRLGLPPVIRKAAASEIRLDERDKKELLKRGGAGAATADSDDVRGDALAEAAREAGDRGAKEHLYGTEHIGGLGSFKPARHGAQSGPIASQMAPQDRLEGTDPTAAGGASLGSDWEHAATATATACSTSQENRERRPDAQSSTARDDDRRHKSKHKDKREKKHKKEKHKHKHKRHHHSRSGVDGTGGEGSQRQRHDSDDSDDDNEVPAQRRDEDGAPRDDHRPQGKRRRHDSDDAD